MERRDHAHGHDGAPNAGGGSESQNPSPKDKGKGKAKTNEASIVDRLQASGRMAVNAVTASQAMPAVAQGSKAVGSSRNVDQSSIMPGEPSSRIPHQPGPSEAWKAAGDAEDLSAAFDAFITGPQASLPRETFNMQGPGKSVAEQEASDGSAVVHLLSLPDDPTDILDPKEEHDSLSPAEAERLREALFRPADADSQLPWEKLLDFDPDFILHPEASQEAALHLGTTDVAAARSLWLQQWSDVFSAYNIQVWGDLEPLVVEAKLEVGQLAAQQSANKRAPEAKALGRLRQILAHVRGDW